MRIDRGWFRALCFALFATATATGVALGASSFLVVPALWSDVLGSESALGWILAPVLGAAVVSVGIVGSFGWIVVGCRLARLSRSVRASARRTLSLAPAAG